MQHVKRRVEQNSELKRGNYGRISSNGVCFWDGWSGCTRSFRKTNKDPKRKRNSRRELQGRVIHCSVPIRNCGVRFSCYVSCFLIALFFFISTNLKAQSKIPFIPDDFEVPITLETKEYRLRMLSINDVDMDYEAVMSSANHLSQVWPDSNWPEGLTLEQNLIDLAWHQKEFQRRTSFAYTMVTLDEKKVIGCVYFYPTSKLGYDTEVFMWVRESELTTGLDSRLFETVRIWLKDDWLFENPAFPGRLISWEDWEKVPQ